MQFHQTAVAHSQLVDDRQITGRTESTTFLLGFRTNCKIKQLGVLKESQSRFPLGRKQRSNKAKALAIVAGGEDGAGDG